MSTLAAFLKELVAELSAELPEVSERRMFGSDAFFANSTIYSLVWDGRICLRFPDAARFEKARALDGADIFDPMGVGKTMRGWVVMPEAMSDDVEELRPWVEEAHREAMIEPPKKKAAQKKPAPKAKVSAPRAPARRKGTRRATRA